MRPLICVCEILTYELHQTIFFNPSELLMCVNFSTYIISHLYCVLHSVLMFNIATNIFQIYHERDKKNITPLRTKQHMWIKLEEKK